jgi:rhomboid protease GluP
MAEHSEVLVQWGSNYGPRTLHGEWWRLGSSMFLHFGLLHVGLNMWALWGSGKLAERLYGSWHFLAIYLFAGLTGSMCSVWWNPAVNSAGASGAIFGVIGALLAFMLNPATRIPTSIARTQLSSLGVFVAYNLLNGFSHAGIDNAAHFGGLVGGFGAGWLMARPLTLEARNAAFQRIKTVLTCASGAALVGIWVLAHDRPYSAEELAFQQAIRAVDAMEQHTSRRMQELAKKVEARQAMYSPRSSPHLTWMSETPYRTCRLARNRP